MGVSGTQEKESVMKAETGIMAGCYRNWSTKTSAQKAEAYREEAGAVYLEVMAELERLGVFPRQRDVPKAPVSREQQMIRELQSIFCKSRYRSWGPSSGL
jgi:hypothetical protein